MPRLLWEVARRSFRRSSQYRLATASGVAVNTVFGYLRASILVFIATAGGGAIRGLTGDELATFAFVSQAFIMIVGAFGDRELADRVRTGDIVIDLYRPADLQLWWLASWLGKSAFQVAARGVPPIVLGAIVFDLRWPDPWWHWLPFALAVVVASIIGFGLRFCSSLTTFWLLDSRGVDQMVTILIYFFAGLILPLSLFPAWLEPMTRWLPFASLVQLPAEIYLGLHSAGAIVGVLAQQVGWAIVIVGFGRWMMARATAKVVIQGG